jgi:hypothetical protein
MPALPASFLATCLLMAGEDLPLLLFAGRFVAGVSSGLAFGTGAAWVKELSADARPHPRRRHLVCSGREGWPTARTGPAFRAGHAAVRAVGVRDGGDRPGLPARACRAPHQALLFSAFVTGVCALAGIGRAA